MFNLFTPLDHDLDHAHHDPFAGFTSAAHISHESPLHHGAELHQAAGMHSHAVPGHTDHAPIDPPVDHAPRHSHCVMEAADFQSHGRYDPIHHCNVLGDVASDMTHIQQQTNGSCSLMAQEQFVERHYGVHVPEAVLEKLAGSWGVYSPHGGTTFPGQDAILDYFDIPHQRFTHAGADMLDRATGSGQDALVSVDARHFYHDPTIPPDSAHAVAIVGKGIDPASGATKGYYFTDSNHPGTARFLTVDEVTHCWYGDMITVPARTA